MSYDNGKGYNFVSSELKQKLKSLYHYLSVHLGIKQSPKLVLTNSSQNSENPFGLTGYYDDKKQQIRIFVTNRHDTDICRSFAHEVVHHWQNENGTLHNSSSNGGTVAHYAQDDQHLRKKEMEAYLFGNILFRDWQDECRYGPPKIQPLMPQPINESILSNIKENNFDWNDLVNSMVFTVEEEMEEKDKQLIDEYDVYDIIKSSFGSQSDQNIFDKACASAIKILKQRGKIK